MSLKKSPSLILGEGFGVGAGRPEIVEQERQYLGQPRVENEIVAE